VFTSEEIVREAVYLLISVQILQRILRAIRNRPFFYPCNEHILKLGQACFASSRDILREMGRKKERHIDTNNVYCQNIFNEKMILQKLDNSSVSLQRGLIVGAIITVVLRIIITIITSRLEKHDRYRMQLIGLYNL